MIDVVKHDAHSLEAVMMMTITTTILPKRLFKIHTWMK